MFFPEYFTPGTYYKTILRQIHCRLFFFLSCCNSSIYKNKMVLPFIQQGGDNTLLRMPNTCRGARQVCATALDGCKMPVCGKKSVFSFNNILIHL
jgi:hypothetical protein